MDLEGLLVIFALAWLAGAIVVGTFAEKRGRSGVAYFFIGALFSPLLAAVLLVVDMLPPRPRGQWKLCPFCDETVRIKATRCRFCCSELPQAEVAEVTKD
jgi:hypothetical protein